MNITIPKVIDNVPNVFFYYLKSFWNIAKRDEVNFSLMREILEMHKQIPAIACLNAL